MIVLKIIGIIIAAVAALIVLILSVKVRIFAEYSEIDTHVYLQWLFLKIPLYPFEKKEKKKKEEKAPEALPEGEAQAEEPSEAAEEPAEETPGETPAEPEEGVEKKEEGKPQINLLKEIYNSQGVDGLLLIVKRISSYIGTYVGKLMKTMVVDELYVDVKCAKVDAAETAIYYGEVCSALFPLMGALVSKYKVRKYDINVYPDFLAKHSSASFAANIHMYPIYVISISVALGIKILFKIVLGFVIKLAMALVKANKSVQNTEKKESVKNK